MQPMKVSIAEDGTIRFLVNEQTQPFLDALQGQSTVRRASHVEPVSPSLRLAFHGLRSIFGEYGWVSKFTRVWWCEWRINLSPIGGFILPQTYYVRAEAIDAEVRHLNEYFI